VHIFIKIVSVYDTKLTIFTQVNEYKNSLYIKEYPLEKRLNTSLPSRRRMAGMMMKMMMPSMPSVPKVGGEDESAGMSREDQKEVERQRKEDIARAEKERKARYLKERDARDGDRDVMRDKYKITKKPRDEEEEEESEDGDDGFGPKKKVEEQDTVSKAKAIAEDKLKDATNMMSSLFKF
jgi:hypothetical protein